MNERRALPRHKTFMKGRIYFNNRLSSTDCIVRELAANGSRLEVSETVTLPDTFELYLPTKDEYFHAKVEWRRGNSVGISWDQEQLTGQTSEQGGAHLLDRLAKLEREVASLRKRLDSLQGLNPGDSQVL
jgi:hypothetical protein